MTSMRDDTTPTIQTQAVARFPFALKTAAGTSVNGAAVLLSREDKKTRQDKAMCLLTLGHALGRATMPVWSEQLGEITALTVGAPVVLTCRSAVGRDGSSEWQFLAASQLPHDHPIAQESQPICPVPRSALITRTNAIQSEMSDEAREILLAVMRTTLQWGDGKTQSIGTRFKEAPAAVGYHHATSCGLWWHSLQVAEGAMALAQAYRGADAPTLDMDAVQLGAWLHDIGKLDEISWNGSYAISPMGRASTHMGWGIRRLAEALTRAELGGDGMPAWLPTARQRELILHMYHVISSHHGIKDFGALVEPCSREAHLISAADNASAHVQPISDAIEHGSANTDGWITYKAGWKQSMCFVSPTVAQVQVDDPVAEGDAHPKLRLLLPTSGRSA